MDKAPLYVGAGIIFIIGALLFGFVAAGAPGEMIFIVFAIAIVLAAATRPLAKAWNVQQTISTSMQQDAKKESLQRRRESNRRMKKIATMRRHLDAEEKKVAKQSSSKSFDDLDPATSAILQKAIKDARKSGVKVSVPGLLGEITKNIK